MSLKPLDLENACLLALWSLGDPQEGRTVHQLWRRLTTAAGKGPTWRQVANSVTRLERLGHLAIVGDQQIGEDCHPLFALSGTGRALARNLQQLRPKALEEFRHGECA